MSFKKLYILFLFCALILTQSCGGFFKMTDAREVSPNPNERVKKNMDEGRGLRIAGAGKKGGEFQQKSFVKKFVKLKSDLQCYAIL